MDRRDRRETPAEKRRKELKRLAALHYTDLKRTQHGAYMLADLLEKTGIAPIVGYMPPLWVLPTRGALASIVQSVHIPTLNWQVRRDDIPTGTPLTSIDANAAFLAAASSARFAHGELTHTGAHDPERDYIYPGFYLVDAHHWNGPVGSPLGAGHVTTSTVWVAHPTYQLLRDITHGCAWTQGGHWADIRAYDSWTCQDAMSLLDWTSLIRDWRAQTIDAGDEDAYESLKLGYSQAIQMWATEPDPKGTPRDKQKKHNAAYRPDWFAAVRAQHAATMWRRAFMCHEAGHTPIALGGEGHATDGMAFESADLRAVLALPKSPIRLDETGKSLGTFKRTDTYLAGGPRRGQ